MKPERTMAAMFAGFTDVLAVLGDFSAFSLRAVGGVFNRSLRFQVLIPIFYSIGVRSVTVVSITGVFLGMVLAVQAYAQFHQYRLDVALGTISIGTILNELGPVLAAVMLAGRVGSAMAAELGTMRVTEQIDALACLGVDPVHYLATPRFLACLMLIPLLTILGDGAGIVGCTFISVGVYGVDSHQYWVHVLRFVGLWELLTGIFKAVVFGGVLSLISCHRGFHSGGGAEGVGRAATQSFVASFIAILILDFFLTFLLNGIRPVLEPNRPAPSFA